MRRAILRWLGAADAGHVAQLDGRVRELSRMVTALAWVEAEVAAPDYSDERADMADAHLVAAARDWMGAIGGTKLPQVRVRAPEEGARAALLAYLVALGLVVAALCTLFGCTIRGSRDAEPPPDLAAPDMRIVRPAPPICGTLLPGRMP